MGVFPLDMNRDEGEQTGHGESHCVCVYTVYNRNNALCVCVTVIHKFLI